ncbi:MAG: hypothetical protein J6J06_03890 [Bacteroidaceae bacterium]|nr:hypothetical protein [Bacteroidaceae bacterium]
MGLFSKRKKTVERDAHSERYEFEHYTLPSAATFAPIQLFTSDFEGNILLDLMFDNKSKESSWFKHYAEHFSMKIYDVVGGQISFLRFPESEVSPSLVCAAVPLHKHLTDTMKDESDLYYRPYYFLTKLIDKWCFGEMKIDKECREEFFYPVYYKMVDSPDMVEFMQWVMEREGLSKNADLLPEDTITEFLNNK